MFGYSIIKTSDLNIIKERASRWGKLEVFSWWPHQAFVCRLLIRIANGENNNDDMREEFNRNLHEYVSNGGRETKAMRERIVKMIHGEKNDFR